MKFNLTTILISCGVILLLSGCSLMNKKTQFVTIAVEPADATIIANGVEYQNSSTQFIEVNPARELLILAYKKGYHEKRYIVDYQLSSTGTIDAWSSIIIFPFFGLLSNGAWELQENNISLKLEKLTPEELQALSEGNTKEPAHKESADK